MLVRYEVETSFKCVFISLQYILWSVKMNQAEPIAVVGETPSDMAQPLQVMSMDETPTMEGRSKLRTFLVIIALAVS